VAVSYFAFAIGVFINVCNNNICVLAVQKQHGRVLCQFHQHFTSKFSYESVFRSFTVLQYMFIIIRRNKIGEKAASKSEIDKSCGLFSPAFEEKFLR